MRRKIYELIEDYLKHDQKRILCIDGARQTGKTYSVREIGRKCFRNFVEINFADDKNGDKIFANVNSVQSFYLILGAYYGKEIQDRENTLIFIDEIQEYPAFLTLLKPLREDNRFKYICSGSQLGLALKKSTLIPMGSIRETRMYPLDFEEFLWANNVSPEVIAHMKEAFLAKRSLDEPLHKRILGLFKLYLLLGGLPSAVNEYMESNNIASVREIHQETMKYYIEDAAKYDAENKLKIERIYSLIPSTIENKVKRLQFKMVEDIDDARYSRYADEFDYLLSSGIALGTRAISEPKFPLIESGQKNLFKLYLNDVGLLTNVLYRNNVLAVLEDGKGVNLGAVYETVVAQELKAHNHELFYYDSKKVGEVDYLIDDYDSLSVRPIEVKSGRDHRNFRALPKVVQNGNYHIDFGYVLNNEREVVVEDKIVHMPIYFAMFL